jgi:putative tricarboxylic transport membrane protein
VQAFKNTQASPEFADLQKKQGLFPFNKTGAELDAYVKERVKAYTELANSFGLIKK